MKPASLVLVVLVAILALGTTNLAVAQPNESNTPPDISNIPPEISKQFGPEVISGKKPLIVALKQAMLFDLRTTPKLDADLVELDLEPDKLSTAQRAILEQWLKAGHNHISLRIYSYYSDRHQKWYDKNIVYAPLFGLKTDRIQGKDLALTKHPVNTDVKDLSPTSLREITGYPDAGAEMIARGPKGMVIGSFFYGKTKVFYHGYEWLDGSDSQRFKLNIGQWMIGLKIPGAADVNIAMAGVSERQGKPTYDVLTLKNGDKLSGVVQNKDFVIKTSYAELTFTRDKIDQISIEGGGKNVDTVLLKTGDRLTGVLRAEKVDIQIVGGQSTSISRDKLTDIVIRFDQSATTTPSGSGTEK